MSTAPARCLDCLVRDTALCAAMRDDELEALSAFGRRRVVPRGQVVRWSGDPSTLCANVVSGALKVTAATGDGREQIVGLLFPGDFVGQPFEEAEPLTVTTLAETDLCSFPRPSFERVLDAHPRVERLLLQRTLASLNDARQRMLSLGRRSAQERVAGFLLDVAARTLPADVGDCATIDIPIGRGEMADYLGLTIETVSRQLKRLKAQRLIEYARGERRCTIVSRAALAAAAGPD